MSYDLQLVKLKDDLETEIPFSAEEWEKCAIEIPNLKLDKSQWDWTLLTYTIEFEDWLPVLWISLRDYSARITQNIIGHEENFAKLVEIAIYFKAFILGEDGTILFMPQCGLLTGNEYEDKNVDIDLYTLIDLKNRFDNDLAYILRMYKHNQKEEARKLYEKFLNKQKYTNYKPSILEKILAFLGVW